MLLKGRGGFVMVRKIIVEHERGGRSVDVLMLR